MIVGSRRSRGRRRRCHTPSKTRHCPSTIEQLATSFFQIQIFSWRILCRLDVFCIESKVRRHPLNQPATVPRAARSRHGAAKNVATNHCAISWHQRDSQNKRRHVSRPSRSSTTKPVHLAEKHCDTYRILGRASSERGLALAGQPGKSSRGPAALFYRSFGMVSNKILAAV